MEVRVRGGKTGHVFERALYACRLCCSDSTELSSREVSKTLRAEPEFYSPGFMAGAATALRCVSGEAAAGKWSEKSERLLRQLEHVNMNVAC